MWVNTGALSLNRSAPNITSDHMKICSSLPFIWVLISSEFPSNLTTAQQKRIQMERPAVFHQSNPIIHRRIQRIWWRWQALHFLKIINWKCVKISWLMFIHVFMNTIFRHCFKLEVWILKIQVTCFPGFIFPVKFQTCKNMFEISLHQFQVTIFCSQSAGWSHYNCAFDLIFQDSWEITLVVM